MLGQLLLPKFQIKGWILVFTASENKFKRVIANLNDGSPGKDGVTAKTLKTVSDAVATPITHLANLSFIQGIFPQDQKKCSCMPHI